MLDGDLTVEEFWEWVKAEAEKLGIDTKTK